MSNDYKNKEMLVIDLGSYSIKALVGKAGPKGISVRKAFTVPISTNIYMNGDVQNYLELTNILKDIVKDHSLRNYPVIFTFSSTGSFARVLEVPAVQGSDMKEVVEYEMKQYLPADVSAYITQYRNLPGFQAKADAPVKVIVGTIPKAMAENLWNIARECELVPVALDMHPNALVKLLGAVSEINGIGGLDKESIAFLEIGHTLMDVSIFEKGEFQFHRRLMIGGRNIDQRIERLVEVSIDEARVEKHNNIDINQEVFDYTDENRVFNSLKSGVDEWISEYEKVAKFYTSRKVGNRIDRCFIYGGSAEISGIDKYMSHSLEVPVEIIHRLGDFAGGEGLSNDTVHLFVNAMGAMLRKEESKK